MVVEVTQAGRAVPGAGGAGNRLGRPLLRMPPLAGVVVKRLMLAVPLLFIVTFLSFLLEALTPGDAARAILGINATPAQYEHLRRELGLNLPLIQQYWHWLKPALQGNLGVSLFSGQSVTGIINSRLPVTVSLIVGSLLVTVVFGLLVGVIGAVRGGLIGRMLDGVTLLGFAIPPFWAGAVLIALFAVKLGWFPATGYVSWSQSPTEWLRSLALPVFALSLNGIAAVGRQTRDAMLDALGSEYIRMARANGVPERRLIFRHSLRNAGMRVVTILGVQAVALLGGTVLVESVFALPGLGGLIVTAATQHDVPVVQGVVVYFTLIVVIINLTIDMAASWLNPRVRAR